MDLETSMTVPATPPSILRSQSGQRMGRYVLEKELGSGAMGVVYLGYDSVLERRVAIKVPHDDHKADVRRRLVREARAMARVTHPNVVAVYETGSVAGREFVAMELADDETLADWLAGARRSRAAILEAFIAAGRGLAAAHAAGLVHRDFKPSNVLRCGNGRFAVADFGLAVEPHQHEYGTFARGSSQHLATQIAGTPAYMAPEQWSGEITPASDQYSFCVALWEALTGKRPYEAFDQIGLVCEINDRHAALAADLPRSLRKALVRGLSLDPDHRWRNMDALLAALVPPRPRRFMIAGAAALAVLGVSVLVSGRAVASQEPVAACDLGEPVATAVADPALASTLDRATLRWRQLGPRACAATERRESQLSCLVGVRERLDAIRGAAATATEADDLAGRVIAPDVCTVANPPRLAHLTPLAVDALTHSHRFTNDVADRALASAGDDACGRAFVLLAVLKHEGSTSSRVADDVLHTAGTCGDERLLAEVQLALAFKRLEARADASGELARAADAVERVSQPDLVGELDTAYGRSAWARGRRADAIALYTRSLAEIDPARIARKLQVVLWRNSTLVRGASHDDLALARQAWREWRSHAKDGTKLAYDLDATEISARLFSGDLEGAHQLGERSSSHDPEPRPVGTRSIRGIVVDEQGQPVAGARVIAAEHLHGDSSGVDRYAVAHQHPVVATTASDGTYALEQVADWATVVAEHGDLRSTAIVASDAPATDRLVLLPTTTIRGRVAPNARAANIFVIPRAPGSSVLFHQLAAIAPDGTFVLEHAPVGLVDVGLRIETTTTWRLTGLQRVDVPISGVSDLVLEARPGRQLSVTVRNALSGPLAGAYVFIVPNPTTASTRHELEIVLHADGATHTYAPGPSEELTVTFDKAPFGESTLCATSLSGDMSNPTLRQRLRDNPFDLEIHCQPLPADAASATIDVMPMKRI